MKRRMLFTALLGILLLASCTAGSTPRPRVSRTPSAMASSGKIRNGRVACAGPDSRGAMQIFSYAPDGTDRKQLTSTGLNDFPSWSRDGSHIVFASQRAGTLPSIWMMDADGGQQRQLSPATVYGITPFVSPDGKRIAFTGIQPEVGYPEIWMMDADGSNARRLTVTGLPPAGPAAGSVHPTWSADGSKIVYASARSGHTQIWVMDADGSHQTQLTHGNGPHSPDSNVPDWSLNGSKIVFWSGFEGQYGDVWAMDANGRNKRQITETPAPLNSDNPHWSADGTKILFTSNRSGSSRDVWVVEATGGDPHLFASGMDWCTWQPLL